MPEPILHAVILYFTAINLIAALLAVSDKRRARRGRWRIPEKTLLLFGLLGGATGEFAAMLLIHHKTKHLKFMLLLPFFILLHLGAAFVVYFFLL